MSPQLLTATPHPLKTEINKSGLALWQVRKLLGGRPSEGYLSRTLSGIQPMPPALEARITKALSELSGGAK